MAFQAQIATRYRLSPQDLAQVRYPIPTEITSAAVMGLEEVTVLLCLRGFPKPLALTPAQHQLLIEATGSPNVQDWAGFGVLIELDAVDKQPVIALQPLGIWSRPKQKQTFSFRGAPSSHHQATASSSISTIIMFIVLIVTLALVFFIENNEALWILFSR